MRSAGHPPAPLASGGPSLPTGPLIAAYLVAIVGANAAFALWGLAVEPWNSLLLIGLDLTVRDVLHRAWGGRGLAWKMAGLILVGSLLSALLGLLTGDATAGTIEGGVLRVAAASGLAFGSAATVDAVTYGLLRRAWLRVNGSNLLGALADSAVFPWVVFGVVDWSLAVYFAVVKFGGGFLWWLVLGGWRDLRTLVAPPRATASSQ